jgi:protein phosphatase 1 regulatory subunit 7
MNRVSYIDNEGNCIIVSDIINEQIEYINNNDVASIYINNIGYKDTNINFLEFCPNIKKVNIYNDNINDLSGLYKLVDLKILYISDLKCEIDLSKLRKLIEFRGDFNKNIKGLDECVNLETLSLSKYKTKNKNLEELAFLKNSKYLEIIQSQITSLNGIENLKKINELDFYSLPKL